VPEQLVISVDLRHPERDVLDGMVTAFRDLAKQCAAPHDIGVDIEQIWHMPPTAFDRDLVGRIERAAVDLGLKHMAIVSGAGHDSLHTAQFAPTAMIFVPCTGGLSHNEAEEASAADLAAGADVLLQAVLAVADEED
jgi:N-carbamoyl-L-amino-acid hydrolase